MDRGNDRPVDMHTFRMCYGWFFGSSCYTASESTILIYKYNAINNSTLRDTPSKSSKLNTMALIVPNSRLYNLSNRTKAIRICPIYKINFFSTYTYPTFNLYGPTSYMNEQLKFNYFQMESFKFKVLIPKVYPY